MKYIDFLLNLIKNYPYRYTLRSIRFLKKLRNKPGKVLGHFIYYLHHLLLKLINWKKDSLPKLQNSAPIILRIKIDENIKNKFLSDLNANKEIYQVKKNLKYYLSEYRKTELKEVFHAWNFDRTFYSDFFQSCIGGVIRELYYGFNYRIEHIWLFKTLNFNDSLTKNLNTPFHTDNDAPGALKVIVYLCDVDENNGPFEYIDPKTNSKVSITGKIGTTIIFNQNDLLHSGSATLKNERIALTFLLYPTLRKNIHYLKKKPANVLFSLNPFTKYS